MYLKTFSLTKRGLNADIMLDETVRLLALTSEHSIRAGFLCWWTVLCTNRISASGTFFWGLKLWGPMRFVHNCNQAVIKGGEALIVTGQFQVNSQRSIHKFFRYKVYQHTLKYVFLKYLNCFIINVTMIIVVIWLILVFI